MTRSIADIQRDIALMENSARIYAKAGNKTWALTSVLERKKALQAELEAASE